MAGQKPRKIFLKFLISSATATGAHWLVMAALIEWGLSAYWGTGIDGQPVDAELLQYLSPLGWEHINLTGDYVWRSSAKVGAGKFRPLRPLPGASLA